jgi:hypothetical protein
MGEDLGEAPSPVGCGYPALPQALVFQTAIRKAPARRADEGDLLVVPPQLRRHPWSRAATLAPANGGKPAELTKHQA